MKKIARHTLLSFTVVLSYCLCLSAQHTGGEPKWSQDGKQITYVHGDHLEVQVDGKYPETREIMIMNADGSNPKRLTSNKYSDEYPALSPDGKTILFSTNRDGAWKLYTMNVDGSNQRDLGMGSTSSIWNDPCRADWSPDGKQFCFPRQVNGERILHTANADGTGVREIPNAKGIYPHWSRNGKSVTFYSKGNIHTINIDGTDRRQLTNNTDPAAYETRPVYPQWSNDGSAVYYLKGDHIFKINADGTGEKQISNIAGQKWYLGVSVKNKLVYGAGEEKYEVIYTLDIDGSNPKLITTK